VFEAIEAIRIIGKCGRKNLDRNRTIEPRIAGAVHLPHPTGAQGAEDFVGAEFGAGG